MTLVHRVLYPTPIGSLDEYVEGTRRQGTRRGPRAAAAKRSSRCSRPPACAGAAAPDSRPGASGARCATTARPSNARRWSSTRPRANPGRSRTARSSATIPYQVLEGALIAALAVDADQIIVATKQLVHDRGRPAARRHRRDRGAPVGPTASTISIFEGPNEYLYGEETALLETIDGRYPFPRIAPPYRRGVREVVESPADVGTDSGLSAHVEMAGPGADTEAPPDAGRQRRDARERRADPGARRGVVPHRGNAGVAGNDRVHRDGLDGAQRRRRSHHGHAAARSDRGDRRRRAPGPADPRGAPRRLERVHRRRRARHARELRSARRDRQRPRFRRLHRLRRLRRSRRGRGRRLAVPRRRVVRAVHAVQARRAAHRRAARQDRRAARRRPATSTSCGRGSRRSPTVRAARWPRSSRLLPRASSNTSRTRSARTSTSEAIDGAALPVAELVDIARRRRAHRRTPRAPSNPTGRTTPSTPASRPRPASANTATRNPSPDRDPRRRRQDAPKVSGRDDASGGYGNA